MSSEDLMFETARTRVRHITRDDYDAMYATYSDPDAMRWVGDGSPITAEDCRRWVEVTLTNYVTRGYGMSAVVEQATGDVIGFCGLVHPGGQVEAELKYALRRPCWGRGLASEVAAGMVAHGAGPLGLTHVIATVAPAHKASRRVLEKAGLRFAEMRIEDDGEETAVYEWRAANETR